MKNEIKKHISLSLRDSIDTEENITYLCMHRLWISRRWRIKSSRLWWGRKASCLARGEKAAPCQRTFKRGFKSTGQAQIKTPPHVPNIHPKPLRTPTLSLPSIRKATILDFFTFLEKVSEAPGFLWLPGLLVCESTWEQAGDGADEQLRSAYTRAWVAIVAVC